MFLSQMIVFYRKKAGIYAKEYGEMRKNHRELRQFLTTSNQTENQWADGSAWFSRMTYFYGLL